MKKTKGDEVIYQLTVQFAQTIQRITGKPRQALMEQAEQAAILVQGMKSNVVSFAFIGQDGMVHKEKGTLVHYLRDFKRPYRAKPYSRFILYYSVEKRVWRTFQVQGLVIVNCK